VDKASELQLKTDYNRTHPPLDTQGVPASFDDNTIHEETEDGHNDPGTGYVTYNQSTYSGSTGTFPGSSSVPVPSAYGYQQGGSYRQGGTFQQSGTQTWTRGQDPHPMSRSTSQPGYYGAAGSSGNMYYAGSQPIVQGQQRSHQNYPSSSVDSVPVDPEVDEGDRHRRGSIHSSEHHSSNDPGEAQALVEKEELEEEIETEIEGHYGLQSYEAEEEPEEETETETGIEGHHESHSNEALLYDEDSQGSQHRNSSVRFDYGGEPGHTQNNNQDSSYHEDLGEAGRQQLTDQENVQHPEVESPRELEKHEIGDEKLNRTNEFELNSLRIIIDQPSKPGDNPEDDLYDASEPEDERRKAHKNDSKAAPAFSQDDVFVQSIKESDGTRVLQYDLDGILEEAPKAHSPEEAIAKASQKQEAYQPTLLPSSGRTIGESPAIKSTLISRSSSLYSLQSLIFSNQSTSSVSSTSSYPHNGEKLFAFLSNDIQLQTLFDEAARKIPLDRFEKNFRRCLQLFSEHLRIEGKRFPLLLHASTVVRHFSTNAAHSIRRVLEDKLKASSRPTLNLPQEIESSDEEDDRVEDQEEESIPDLELALYESNSLQMLRDNLRLFLSPDPAERAVFEAWPPDQSRSLPEELIHHIECELVSFLDTNYEQGQTLGQILTLSGQDDDAQASSCKEYLAENWPEAGPLLLEAIEKFFTVRDCGKCFFESRYYYQNDREKISIRAFQDDVGPKMSKFHIIVKAQYPFQVQMTAAISWLCATCRQSPYDNICRSSVAVKADDAPDKKQPRIADFASKTLRYSLLDLQPVASTESCWQDLFPRCVLAYGFPIRPRNKGVGLEINFADMVMVSRCLSFVEYDCGFIAHGLTSLLIPTGALEEDNAVQWHFENKTKQFPGRLCRVSEIMRLTKFKDWHRVPCPDDLVTRRCFLGLAKSADVVIGTKGYQPEFVLSRAPIAKEKKEPTEPYVNSQRLATGPGYVEFTSSSGNVVRFPTSAQPVTYSRSNQDLCDALKCSRNHLVLLYDTKNETGWYLPQASVVLHMVHAKISNRNYQLYDDDRMISNDNATAFSSIGSDGWAGASEAILRSVELKVRKYYCPKKGPVEDKFGDFIQNTWHTLDNIETYLASKEGQFQNHAPDCIHGVEYVHAMNEEPATRMHIKEAIVNQAWAHLTSLERIVIFTKDIPPPIIPDASSLCKAWMNVPSGQKYLVAMGTAAQYFLDQQDAGIAEDVSWEVGKELIQSHELGCNTPIFHVQKLRATRNPRPNEPILAAIAGSVDSCLVFGNDSEKECLEALDSPEPSSPEEMSNNSAPRLDGSIFDLSSTVDQDAVDGGDTPTSECSQDTCQNSISNGSLSFFGSAESGGPESSSSAVVRLQKVEEDCDGPSTYTLSKSSQGALVGISSSRLAGSKKWKPKGKYTRPSSSGQEHASSNSVPRGVTIETLPKKLDQERRRIEDDPNRIEGKRRENTNTAKRERT
jgi:hypothetical protein